MIELRLLDRHGLVIEVYSPKELDIFEIIFMRAKLNGFAESGTLFINDQKFHIKASDLDFFLSLHKNIKVN